MKNRNVFFSIVFGLLASSISASAIEVVQLKFGETIVVQANVSTKVSCGTDESQIRCNSYSSDSSCKDNSAESSCSTLNNSKGTCMAAGPVNGNTVTCKCL